ncbi:signal peptidase II [Mesoplasma coleopterae]|uniref:Signal peptidase II n=1 Tax=Mesoplasma coleopterae TaxID=324078 RepID=A0A2K8P2K7_9MOLU|nr:signal peptidase II [Mesoplasma coleopterae]ATZ20916.1 signal peptidase II [Mesoplasma coleopterae]
MFKNKISNLILGLKSYNFKWKFKLIVATPIMSFLILSDWIIKWIVVATMKENDSKTLINGFLNLQYKINLGSAYGRGDYAEGLAKTITLATLFVAVLIIVFIFLNDKKWIITCSILLAGGFANLLARAWAPATIRDGQEIYGGVVDMFVWGFNFLGSSGYIFNLADMWVNIGVGIGALCFIIEIVNIFKPKKEKEINKEVDKNDVKS